MATVKKPKKNPVYYVVMGSDGKPIVDPKTGKAIKRKVQY